MDTVDNLTLEEVLVVLTHYDFIEDPRLPTAGFYYPDKCEIKYNPQRVEDEKEFYITLLHEIIHAADIPCHWTETEIEKSAKKSYQNKEILNCLKTLFPYNGNNNDNKKPKKVF